MAVTSSARRTDVALLLPSLNGGGAERVLAILAREFAGRGLQVDLVAVNGEGPLRTEVPADVQVVDLGGTRVLSALPRLLRYLRRARPRALLSTHSHVSIAAAFAYRALRLPERLILREANTPSRKLAGRPLMLLALRHAYRAADAVVAVSAGVADDLVRHMGVPAAKIQVIYNPSATGDIPSKAAARCDHPWLAGGGHPVVLAVGSLTPQKDHATLLRAFARVCKGKSCRLIILGEGKERRTLEALVDALGLGEVVHMPGFDENPFRFMSRASVLVLSSRWEGLPNVLIQGMAVGIPIVSTDCPSGPAEILEGGKWGTLVPVGDVACLAEALLQALERPIDRDKLRERAAFFSGQGPIDAYLALLLSNNRAGGYRL